MLPPKVGYPSMLEVELLKKVRLFYTDVLCSGSLSFERTNEKKQEMQSCLVRFFLMAEGCPAGQQEVQLTFLCLKGIPALLTQREGSLASPFLFFHIHAFSWHWDQFRSEFSPLLPSELFTACPTSPAKRGNFGYTLGFNISSCSSICAISIWTSIPGIFSCLLQSSCKSSALLSSFPLPLHHPFSE